MKNILLIYFLINSLLICAQGQIGSDIYGENVNDFSGRSVSLSQDGSTIVIGSINYETSGGIPTGSANVYGFNGINWMKIGGTIEGEGSLDGFGMFTAISSNGDIVAIGAPFNEQSAAFNNAGHIRVYQNINNVWTQMGSDIDGVAAGDRFGGTISLSANGLRVVSGGTQNDGGGNQSGHARVFDFNGTNWVQTGSTLYGDGTYDYFGKSVSLSSDGETLVVGGDESTSTHGGNGYFKVFTYNGTDWVQKGNRVDGTLSLGNFGFSSDITNDGNRVIIGAYLTDANGTDSGSFSVFDFNGTNWIQVGPTISGDFAGDYFGAAVSISGNGSIISVSAPLNSNAGYKAGNAKVYSFNGSEWEQIGVTYEGDLAEDQLGWGLSLSNDGTRLGVGSVYNDGNGSASGLVRVYDLTLLLSIIEVNTNSNIKLYPNPTSDVLKISGLGSDNSTAKFVDVTGKIVKEIELSNDDTHEINISDIDNAQYFVIINNNGKLISKSIIKN